jgi:mono/diheme cytochrome c family protein
MSKLRRNLAMSIVATALVSGAVGCQTARRAPTVGSQASTGDPKIERGRVAFFKYCHQCHPGGEGGLGPGLSDKPFPAFLLKTQVRLGLGVMPAFHRQSLPSEQLDDLIAYIKSLRRD